MPNNECIPFYEPGTRLTGHATVALTGKRLVQVSADIPGGPTGSETIRVGVPARGGPCVGVAAYDAVLNEKVPLLNGPGMVVPIRAAVAVAAGQRVMATADGSVEPFDTGAAGVAGAVAVGIALSGAAVGADAMIRLYT